MGREERERGERCGERDRAETVSARRSTVSHLAARSEQPALRRAAPGSRTMTSIFANCHRFIRFILVHHTRPFAKQRRTKCPIFVLVDIRAFFLVVPYNINMADDAIPSISTGSVGSRFVSQTDLETAKARREEQWKAAYARYACCWEQPTAVQVSHLRNFIPLG